MTSFIIPGSKETIPTLRKKKESLKTTTKLHQFVINHLNPSRNIALFDQSLNDMTKSNLFFKKFPSK